jgi:uncharacterized membrane protein YccC
MSRAGLWGTDPVQAYRTARWRIRSALRSVAPALLFGLRLWVAVSLALYVAFWLELDNAYWAGTSAAIVCQPSLGASLRKASFRMMGTVVGAVAIVILTACFPQNRLGFLLGLALWGAACGLLATLLRNFAAYSAALAGYTAAIIASDELGAVGGANGDAFMLAITRASEICIGIICAGVVLAGTDFGGARRRLARAFVTIVTVELLWIMTEWPNGAQAITFAAVAVILFSPRADQAYTTTMSFMAGTGLTAALAAIVKFAVLPGVVTFAGFSLAIGLVLVPAGALMAQPWQTAMFTAVAANFVPLLAPANQMSYDTQQFYNAALAIVAGVGVAALAFRLLPPLSPALRTRRLLALTLRDLRRLITGLVPQTANEWEGRVYRRLSALPEQAEPLQRAQLMAALSVGTEIIRLRRVAHGFDRDAELDAALDALAKGDSSASAERLARLDKRLAAVPSTRPGARVRLRARGGILAMSEALAQHAAYFDVGAA